MLNPTSSPRHLLGAIALLGLLSAGCQQTTANPLPSTPTAPEMANLSAAAAAAAPGTAPTITALNTTPSAAPPETSSKAPKPPAELAPQAISQVTTPPASSTSGVQQPDENGDYYQPRLGSDGSRAWRVSDPDPTGLNCRMRRDWRGITFGHVDPPDDFGKDYSANIGSWDVMAILPPGAWLTTDGGHLSQGRFVLDQRGKPWLAISNSESGSPATCFVRANSAFIVPTQPNLRSQSSRSGPAVYTQYRNEKRSILVTSTAPWSGENGTGNFTFQRCDVKNDGCDEVITGGKAACNDVACEIVWEGTAKHSISERRIDSEAIARHTLILNNHTVANNEDVTRYGKAFF